MALYSMVSSSVCVYKYVGLYRIFFFKIKVIINVQMLLLRHIN